MTDAAAPAAAPFPGYGSKGYRAYVLAALVTVYTFNFIDRVVITIIQEPIRLEFGLSDTQLGLLGGPTFAILYTLLGIPIARLAERKNRTTILAVCLGLWSLMTTLCGFAGSYAMLLMARIGVSVGEAGGTPPSQSIIGDYFPAESRATAISIYALGIPLGSAFAAIGGGFIAAYFGWREAFWMLGVPGLILAILIKLTIKEPPRATPSAEPPNFGAALKILGSKTSFWHIAVGGAAASFTGYGVGQFTNSFFIRNHQAALTAMDTPWLPSFDEPLREVIFRASIITGLLTLFLGGLGTFLSGYISDKINSRHPNALAWLPAVGFVIATPLNIAGYMTGSLPLALFFLAAALLLQNFYLGSIYAVAQGVVPPLMRATAVAILLFIVNIIGYGMGPPVIGALSDFLASSQLTPHGMTLAACRVPAAALTPVCSSGTSFGLRWALILGYLGYIWAAAHFLLAWRTLQRDWVR